jgi:hypothetical protein
MPPGTRSALARHARLKVVQVLAGLKMLAGRNVLARRVLAHPDAFTEPDRAGAEQASQLAGAGQVSAVP